MPLFDLPLILELATLGLCTGFMAGLLGIGGGMVMVPFLLMILTSRGYPAEEALKMAVATSLATICFTSLSSVYAHHKRGAVQWRVVGRLAPGLLAGSVLGAQLAVGIPVKVMSVLFAVFVGFSATQMLFNRKPKPSRTLPGPAGLLGAGTVIGGLSALVGAGGAFVSVPFMTWCNMKIHEAVATSAALGFPIALFGTAGYIWAGRHLDALPGAFGYLYLPGLLVVSLASVTMAPIGARTAHRMDVRPLRKIFAMMLYALAAYFLLR